jgi:hypothetical protein
MVNSIIYYKFSNTDKTLTGSLSFDQAAAVDQQVTIAEGLKISGTYGGQTYTQANDALALLLTNQSGEIANQGLGLQFVTNAFTANAENFVDSNTVQTITYKRIYAPTDLVFNTIYNFSSTDKTLTGSLSFNQATAADQQVTIAEGLNVSFTYDGKTYTQTDDTLALLLTNLSGGISDLGLGLQFVTNNFTINAENFVAGNSNQNITYTLFQAPTNSALSAINVNENIAAGTVIASFSTTDPDLGNTFTYSLVPGTDATDNAAFTIDGNNLKINISPDFETKSAYNIRVRTTDNDGLTFDKPLTITINNLNEAPTGLVFDTVYNFSSTDKTLTGSLAFNQATAADQQVTVAEGLNISFTYDGKTYTQTDDTLALLLTNLSGGITDLGLGLQFVTNNFTINADNFVAGNSVQNISYTLVQAPKSSDEELLYVTDQVNATFTVNREAAYDNFVGFYQVADKTGTINVNGTTYKPGDSGYTEAAIDNRVVGLTGTNQETVISNGKFSSNCIFAPFIIVDGNPNTYISGGNPVYFPFLGANPASDKQADHICLLGNNVFGFEDLPKGGDQDFNDIIVGVNLS